MKKFCAFILILSMLFASLLLVGCKEKLPTLPPVPGTESPASEAPKTTPAASPLTETTGEPSRESETERSPADTQTGEPSTAATGSSLSETPGVSPDETTDKTSPGTDPSSEVRSVSGAFYSDTGTALEMELDWTVEKQEDGGCLVTAKVFLNCYSLYCAARTNCNTVTIGDTDYLYSTEKLALETKEEKNHVELCTVTHKIDAGEVPDELYIGASWLFLGKYSKVSIDTLEASGKVKLK